MVTSLLRRLPGLSLSGLSLAALLLAGQAFADSLATVPPLGQGPYPVACSNVSQDFTRVRAGESPADYWEGRPEGARARYVTNLLVNANHPQRLSVAIPNDREFYGRYAGTTLDTFLLICYPTDAGNTRANYVLPTGKAVPHMQQPGEPPRWPDAQTRFPVLLFSHGLLGSPLSSDYIDAINVFASHGYVVVSVFHGDPRVANVTLENFNDIAYAIAHFTDFIALQAVRPVALQAALDNVLNDATWRDRIDPNKVGAFGASLGGQSVLLLGGAALTTTLAQASKSVVEDARVKAAVGYVPYFGISLFPAYGKDQRGVDGVTMPYLAISGTADTTAPIGPTRTAMHRLSGTHQLVALQGVRHGFAAEFSDDIFTWSLMFLAGQLSDNPADRATSARMTSVAGGGDDRLEQDYAAPMPATVDEQIATEYYNVSLDHYFFTTDANEAAMLDAGNVVSGWIRTGFAFKVHPTGDTRGVPACRFFGTPGLGPNSHFFTVDPAECATVKSNSMWTYEGVAFSAELPINADCAADRIPVIRLYNNGKGGQANHRYVTSHSEVGDLRGEGWTVEGPVFCSIP